MKEKNSGCDIDSTFVKFRLTDEAQKAFYTMFKNGIYKELHKQELLSDSQLDTLLHN